MSRATSRCALAERVRAVLLRAVARRECGTRPWSAEAAEPSRLHPRFTFDKFVVGPSNRQAHAAAIELASHPGRPPLYVFGAEGVGKTHLLQSIGHHQLRQGACVRYICVRPFLEQLLLAIRFERLPAFRARFRLVDLLLIDEVEDVGGRERVQEELEDTFEVLHAAGKQVVIAGDRPPDRTPALLSSLHRQLASARIVEILPPERATTLAILSRRAGDLRLILSGEVAEVLADRFPSNVGELERALLYAKKRAAGSGGELTVEIALMALTELEEARSSAAKAMRELLQPSTLPTLAPVEARRPRFPRWEFEGARALRAGFRSSRSRPN